MHSAQCALFFPQKLAFPGFLCYNYPTEPKTRKRHETRRRPLYADRTPREYCAVIIVFSALEYSLKNKNQVRKLKIFGLFYAEEE